MGRAYPFVWCRGSVRACEMADAARLFGLAEHEEWYAIGLFKYHEPEPDHYVHEILRKGKVGQWVAI